MNDKPARNRETKCHNPRLLAASATLCLVACWLATLGSSAMAQTNLVTNGTFTVTGGTTSEQFDAVSGYTPAETLTGWSATGYNFVFLPTSLVATGQYGNLSLWSPQSATPSQNGFTNASPTGGNFIGADGSSGYRGAITQTINGLVVGSSYKLSFVWAGAQQYSFTGVTSEQWQVSFGNQTTTTANVTNIPSEGFTGWMNQTLYFVATNTSQVLSFLANGTPSGVPPFALMSNVSLTNVPEPATWSIVLTSFALLIMVARQRRSAKSSARC